MPREIERDERGKFAKGNSGGRRPGTPNKLPTEIKAALLEAASRLGADGRGRDGVTGWLMTFARRHPVAFAGMLARLLPLSFNTKTEEVVTYRSSEEVAAELRSRGIDVEVLRRFADRMSGGALNGGGDLN